MDVGVKAPRVRDRRSGTDRRFLRASPDDRKRYEWVKEKLAVRS